MRKIYFVLLAIAGFSTGLTGCFDNPYQYYGEECGGNEDCPAEGLVCDNINNVCTGADCQNDDQCPDVMHCDLSSRRCALGEVVDTAKDAGLSDRPISDLVNDDGFFDTGIVADSTFDDISTTTDAAIEDSAEPDASVVDAAVLPPVCEPLCAANEDCVLDAIDGVYVCEARSCSETMVCGAPYICIENLCQLPETPLCDPTCDSGQVCIYLEDENGNRVPDCVDPPSCSANGGCTNGLICVNDTCVQPNKTGDAYHLCSIDDNGNDNCMGNLRCFLPYIDSRAGLCLEPCTWDSTVPTNPDSCSETASQRCLPLGPNGTVKTGGEGWCVKKCGDGSGSTFISSHANDTLRLICSAEDSSSTLLADFGSILPYPQGLTPFACDSYFSCGEGPFACVRKPSATNGVCMLLSEAIVQQSEGKLIYTGADESYRFCPGDTHPIYTTNHSVAACAPRCKENADCAFFAPLNFNAVCNINNQSGIGYCVVEKNSPTGCWPDNTLTSAPICQVSPSNDGDSDSFSDSSDFCPSDFGQINGCNELGSCRVNSECGQTNGQQDICVQGSCEAYSIVFPELAADCPSGWTYGSLASDPSIHVCGPPDFFYLDNQQFLTNHCFRNVNCMTQGSGDLCIDNRCYTQGTGGQCNSENEEIPYYEACFLPETLPQELPCLGSVDCPEQMYCNSHRCERDPYFDVAANTCTSATDCPGTSCQLGRCVGLASYTEPCAQGTDEIWHSVDSTTIMECASCYDITQSPASFDLPCLTSGSAECPCGLTCVPDFDWGGQCVTKPPVVNISAGPSDFTYCQGDGVVFYGSCWHAPGLAKSCNTDADCGGALCLGGQAEQKFCMNSLVGLYACGSNATEGDSCTLSNNPDLPPLAGICLADADNAGSNYCVPKALLPRHGAQIKAKAAFASAGPGLIYYELSASDGTLIRPGNCSDNKVAMGGSCIDEANFPNISATQLILGDLCSVGDLPGRVKNDSGGDFRCFPSYDAPPPYCGYDTKNFSTPGGTTRAQCLVNEICQLGYCVPTDSTTSCPTIQQAPVAPVSVSPAHSSHNLCRLAPLTLSDNCAPDTSYCSYFGDKAESGLCVNNSNGGSTCYPRVGCSLATENELCVADALIPADSLKNLQECNPWLNNECMVNGGQEGSGRCLHDDNAGGWCLAGLECLSYLDCQPGANCLNGRCEFDWFHDNTGSLSEYGACGLVDQQGRWHTGNSSRGTRAGCYPNNDPRCLSRAPWAPCAQNNVFQQAGICDVNVNNGESIFRCLSTR